MGIFIHMCISKAVTKQEWEAVYEETLRLVKAFPLAERRMVNCKGIETMCLTPTVERDVELGRWSEKRVRRGWMVDGDYETMRSAEFYTGTTQEDRYKELMEQSPSARCRWLIEQNRFVLIRDRDWEKIFTDIETNEDSFSRYYPVVRVKLSNMGKENFSTCLTNP